MTWHTIDLYQLDEVFDSLSQNKSRNVSTGFGVTWGVFVLIILLSIGEGFQTSVLDMFTHYTQSSLWIYGGQSSLTKQGNTHGRPILFDSELMHRIRKRFININKISPEIMHPRSLIVQADGRSHISEVKGVNNEYFDIKILEINQGRKFNYLDQRWQRPVCLIGNQVKNSLFEKEERAIGNYVEISGNWFQVVGVISDGTLFSQSEQNVVFIPSNTFRNTFSQYQQFSLFGIALREGTDINNFEDELTSYLAKNLDFDANDAKALFILNLGKQVLTFKKLFNGIKIILWVLGGFLLVNGVVGIANMMQMAIRERQKEIAIRKAVGATPKKILTMIVFESLVITLISGAVGLFFGSIIIMLVNTFLESGGPSTNSMNITLEINSSIAVGTLIMLCISGVFAGIIPAVKAIQIKPAIALSK